MSVKRYWEQPVPQKRLSISLPTLLVIFGFLIIVGLLWGPFGFKSTGLLEEWYRLLWGDQNKVRISTVGSGPRPLSDPFLYVITRLTPGSTTGLDYSILLTFFIKGLMTYKIMRILLPQNAVVAFVTGVLFVLYPAEAEPFAMRAMGAHHSLAVDLIAIYLLLVNYKHRSNTRLRVMVVFLAASCMLYEVTYTTAFLVPLLLVWLDKGLSQRVMKVAAVWYATLAICVTYSLRFYILALSKPKSYAASHTGIGTKSVPELFSTFIESMSSAFERHFSGAWVDAAEYLRPVTIYHAYVLVLALVVGLVTLYLFRRSSFGSSNLRSDIRRYVFFLIVGLIILFLNYAPYAFTDYTWRIYYRTSLGAALSLVMLVLIVLRFIPRVWIRKSLFFILTVVSVYVAGGWALYEQEDLMLRTLAQQEVLSDIAEQAPNVKADTMFIIIGDPYRSKFPLPSSRLLTSALRVLYDDPTINGWLCLSPQADLAGAAKNMYACKFDDDTVSGVRVNVRTAALEGHTFEYPYKEVLLFQLHWPNDIELLQTVPADYLSGEPPLDYDPISRIDQDADGPARARVMLLDWPVDKPLCDDTPVPLVNCHRYKAEVEAERAAASLSRGEIGLALDFLLRAIQYDPDNAELYFNRGAVYEQQQQIDLAIDDYTRAIELDPDFEAAYLQRGNTYYSREMFDLALADYRRYVDLHNHRRTAEIDARIAELEAASGTN